MIEGLDLFNFRKDCIFHALQRNLEWAKWTNEMAMQAKKWCIAYWLIYVGFFAKESGLRITWIQILVGLLGIFFFLAWEVVTHYYSEQITLHRFELHKLLSMLPQMSNDDLLILNPLPVQPSNTWTRAKKMSIILSMLRHETLLYFYFGLASFMLVVLLVLRYYR